MYPGLARLIQLKIWLKDHGWVYISRNRKHYAFWMHAATGQRACNADQAAEFERARIKAQLTPRRCVQCGWSGQGHEGDPCPQCGAKQCQCEDCKRKLGP